MSHLFKFIESFHFTGTKFLLGCCNFYCFHKSTSHIWILLTVFTNTFFQLNSSGSKIVYICLSRNISCCVILNWHVYSLVLSGLMLLYKRIHLVVFAWIRHHPLCKRIVATRTTSLLIQKNLVATTCRWRYSLIKRTLESNLFITCLVFIWVTFFY